MQRLRRLLLADGGLPIVWLVLTCFALYPVWHQRLLPMLDTPNHLALARGWHDFHDRASRISEFYDLRVRMVPYWLFYGSIDVLMYVVDVETANKLFLSAYLVLFPLSVLAVARALGRSAWLALFAFPVAFNQNWIYGFTSYLMSVTLALFCLAALLRWLETRRAVYVVALGVCVTLCYLAHIMPWFLFGLCAIAILLLHARRWQPGLVAAAAMLPSVVMALTAVLDDRQNRTYIKGSTFSATFTDFPAAVIAFPKRVMEIVPGPFDLRVLVTLVLTLVALFVLPRFVPRLRREPGPLVTTHKVILWILVLAYLSLPYEITKPMSWWYVGPRLPSLILVLLALYPAIALTGWRRLILLPVVVCGIALPLKLARLYRSFSKRNMPAVKLIEDTPRGSITLLVVRNMVLGKGAEERSGDSATSAPVYWHFPEWPMALRGGYGPYTFDQGIPIVPKKKLTTPAFGTTDTFNFRQAPEYEYYIVRDATEEMDREPSVKLERRLGEWTLYKRIHAITDEP
ncbi:MAG: hypothetical protein ABI321_05465 [Polyangia bacterium]